MFLDRNPLATKMQYGPTPYSVWDKLKDSDAFSDDDIYMTCTNVIDGVYYMRLMVKIHPALTLTVENYDGLTVTVNGCSKVKNWVRYLSAEETSQWMIRMKQNMPRHIEEWNEILKRIKRQRLAMSVINAIFVNAMKEYPKVRYNIKQQKMRARIDVAFPNGTCKTIYAYWDSYMKNLPGKIEQLKAMIDNSAKMGQRR